MLFGNSVSWIRIFWKGEGFSYPPLWQPHGCNNYGFYFEALWYQVKISPRGPVSSMLFILFYFISVYVTFLLYPPSHIFHSVWIGWFHVFRYDLELVYVKNSHEFVHEYMKCPEYVELMRRLYALGQVTSV